MTSTIAPFQNAAGRASEKSGAHLRRWAPTGQLLALPYHASRKGTEIASSCRPVIAPGPGIPPRPRAVPRAAYSRAIDIAASGFTKRWVKGSPPSHVSNLVQGA